MYKLFINNKTVWIAVNPSHVEDVLSAENEYVIQPYRNQHQLQVLLENVLWKDINQSGCIIYGKAPAAILHHFLEFFICLDAAGGVVENNYGEILLIHRRGSWDLPKGKVDEGETLEQAAVREVEEETGLTGLQMIKPVLFKGMENKATYHSYWIGDKPAMKISYWYEMQTAHEDALVPQTEEDIEQAIWVPKRNLTDYFPEMYPSIVDVLKNVI